MRSLKMGTKIAPHVCGAGVLWIIKGYSYGVEHRLSRMGSKDKVMFFTAQNGLIGCFLRLVYRQTVRLSIGVN